ncbi:GPW/gp25 family protein [Pseudomonas sp. WJP1]|uniref:GPW/gp25 family protein n=1 Tax=Pseudomonas sp. WJP1 TaxID=2986947 RepID=UPI002348F1A4|nr:GPW/gp25 family protein [Pseudomonas sp. WJP1]WCM54384.1 GPW/gp25 family protein [Pseudomonas sp. WJP1]
MALDFPLSIDSRGRSTEVFADLHVRDMIEQVLFTVPGERVNRPDFGCGLLQLVFAPNSDALAAALQMTVQGSLQQWLGELIEVEEVQVLNLNARLNVTVKYVMRQDRQPQLATFSREIGP